MALHLGLPFFLLIGNSMAFITPRPFVSFLHHQTLPFPTAILSDTSLESNLGSSLILTDGIGDILKNVAVAVTFVLFFLAGITFLYASYIIPEAAKRLEEETRELAPELWEEYSAQLKEGETLVMRPDLLQELGEKMTPLIQQKFEKMAQESPTPPPSTTSSDENVVDVEMAQESPTPPPSTTSLDANVVDGEMAQESATPPPSTTSSDENVVDGEMAQESPTPPPSTNSSDENVVDGEMAQESPTPPPSTTSSDENVVDGEMAQEPPTPPPSTTSRDENVVDVELAQELPTPPPRKTSRDENIVDVEIIAKDQTRKD